MRGSLYLRIVAAACCIAVGGCGGQEKQEETAGTSNSKREEVSYYDPVKDECRAKDGSGVYINYSKGFGMDEDTCNNIFAEQRFDEYAREKEKEYPGGLVGPGRYDMSILADRIRKENEAEATASQKRLEDWAVRSYEAEQKHQEKCQDQLEDRGYGDAGCY